MAHVLASAIVENDFVLPLDPYIAGTPGFDTNDIYESLVAGCRYGEQLYCLPFNTSTPVLYYNRDLFREAGLDPDEDFPTTWDELFEVGPKLAVAAAGGELERWVYAVPATGWHFDAYLGQAGGDFLNEDGSAWVFDDEHGMRVVEFWQELIDQNIAALGGSQTEDFFNGRQVIRMESTAQLENYFGQAQFDLGVAPLWRDAQCYAPIGGGSLYLMNFGSDAEKQAAWRFLRWVTDREQAARFTMATGYFAPRQSSYELAELQEYLERRPEALIALDQMERIGHPERQRVPYINEVRSAYATALDEIFRAGADPKRAFGTAVEEADRLLAVYAD
jgi:sn-glycerol 3-phosphate transport system substrate-binding protein